MYIFYQKNLRLKETEFENNLTKIARFYLCSKHI